MKQLPGICPNPNSAAYSAFFASLSALASALLLISLCITKFRPSATPPISPTVILTTHKNRPWLHHGVPVCAIPCAPPLRPTFPSAARTNARGLGTIALARRILLMALATRWDCTAKTSTPEGASSAARAVDQCCRKALLPEKSRGGAWEQAAEGGHGQDQAAPLRAARRGATREVTRSVAVQLTATMPSTSALGVSRKGTGIARLAHVVDQDAYVQSLPEGRRARPFGRRDSARSPWQGCEG